MFRTTGSSVVTLPSRLDSWDRYKGLKRQGRKDDVNIDSSICNPEAIFGDVIRYPEMDIHRTAVCFKITSESENELLSMNFKGKCAIKHMHGLPKLEPSRHVSSKVMKS